MGTKMPNVDLSQQNRTIEKLKEDGWIVLPEPPTADGSILMQLSTPAGISHIIVMLNGDRVDARRRLGKDPPLKTKAP